jgi:hypothetical protein
MWELFFAGMWIVFTLNFHSNLLILYDGDCWNSKEATSQPVPIVQEPWWAPELYAIEKRKISCPCQESNPDSSVVQPVV